MNKIFLLRIKEELLSKRRELLKKSSQFFDVDHSGDETDEIQANVIIGIANQLNAREVIKLSLINEALLRFETNIYGICEDCEEEIPEKRLEANPCFLTCVFCAEKREAQEKQHRKI